MERNSLRTMLVTFSTVFSQPSLDNFVVLVEGWILAGRRAMTSTALAALDQFPKHFSTYFRFFSKSVWSTDALGLALLRTVLAFAPPGPLVAIVDDTIARKTGRHIWGANVHHDPLGFVPRSLCFGHNWVVLGIVIEVPWVQRAVAVPVLWRLYRSRKTRTGARGGRRGRRELKTAGAACGKDYRTRPELAVELLHLLRQALDPERSVFVVGDSAYGGQSVTRHLPADTVCISRLPMNAALYAAPPARRCNGRPRKKGNRLPTPEQMAHQPNGWRAETLHIYGKDVPIHYKTVTALWYNSTKTAPLKIVVVRDPNGRRKDESFFATDPHISIQTMLETYAKRWSLELAFRDVKQHCGFERSQARTAKAVQRSGPFAFVTYTLTVAWFCRFGHHQYPLALRIMPWYRHKYWASFADMHQLLRFTLLHEKFSHTPINMHLFEKSQKVNTHAHKRAA